MYKIYSDNTCIYDDVRPEVDSKVINPKLTLEENSAGKLSFVMPPGNIGYDIVNRMSSLIRVKRDNDIIWEGRVISENKDFYNQRSVTCEGSLAFLNDTIQPPAEYHDITPRIFLERLIAIHNQNSSYQFVVGIVTVTDYNDSIYRYTNYESTLECIKEKLLKRLNGYIKVRVENNVRYIDYLSDYSQTNTQVIRFANNLLDFTRSWDLTELATVIVPRGAKLDESPIEGLEAYLTVASVNGGSIYVQSQQAVSNFGWVCKVVDWDDITVASNLLTRAQNYLSSTQFDEMSLELSAVDMHYLSNSEEPFQMYEKIRCVSAPHGMDKLFPITKMEIQLDDPTNTTYTLGTVETSSLTTKSAKANTDIFTAISNIPSKSEILRSAQENAKNMLLGVDGGVVKFVMNNNDQIEQIWIQNQYDDNQATQRWVWNLNGLGFLKRNSASVSWTDLGVAMTMDGAIVANFITAGTMSCDRLNGGTITGQTINGGTISGTTINGGTITTGMNAGSKLVLSGGNLSGYYNNTRYGSINIGTGTIQREYGRYSAVESIGWAGCFLDFNGQDIYLKGNKLILDFSDKITIKKPSSRYNYRASTGSINPVNSVELQNSESFVYEVHADYESTVVDIGDGWVSRADRVSNIWTSHNQPWISTSKASIESINGLIRNISTD